METAVAPETGGDGRRTALGTEGRRIHAEVYDAVGRARTIVAAAEVEARRLRAGAVDEVAQARAEAVAAGRAEGRQEGLAAAAAALARAAEVRDRLLASATGDLLDAAVALAARILEREVALDAEIVVTLAERALREARGRRRVTVRANPDDLSRLRASASRLAAAAGASGLPCLCGDPAIARGGVVVEAEAGELDARIESQLDELRRALAELER